MRPKSKTGKVALDLAENLLNFTVSNLEKYDLNKFWAIPSGRLLFKIGLASETIDIRNSQQRLLDPGGPEDPSETSPDEELDPPSFLHELATIWRVWRNPSTEAYIKLTKNFPFTPDPDQDDESELERSLIDSVCTGMAQAIPENMWSILAVSMKQESFQYLYGLKRASQKST